MRKSSVRGSNPILVGKRARFTVIHPNCIRIEDDPRGRFVDAQSLFASQRNVRFNDFRLVEANGSVLIDTGFIRLRYRPDNKPLGPANLSAQIRCGNRWVSWKPGQVNKENLGGAAETLDGWIAARPLDDGLLSRDGWFLLDDSKGPILTGGRPKKRQNASLPASSPRKFSSQAGDSIAADSAAMPPDAEIWVTCRTGEARDWYLFGYGRDYRAAFEAFAAIAGPVPMPRRYTLGAWYSRYWPYSDAEFRQIVQEYTDKDFPLDVIVMDMDWHIVDPRMGPHARVQGTQIWTGYTWNRKLLPDPEGLIRWFHEQGLYVTLNDHPSDGIQPHEEMYEAFMRDMGQDPASCKTIPFDAGDRHYLDTFYRHTHEPLDKMGVDFWWLDWQQEKTTRCLPGLTNLQWLNHYLYRKSRQDNLRGTSFSRWAGWGDHKYPIHFSGDASTDWKMLAAEVPFTAVSGNAGCFFWSHDIGGHRGNRNEESYTRWCQFGALSAALRSHSTKDADKDRRPWKHEKWAENSMRRSFHLRSQLFPYIYSAVAQSCRDTFPMIRPMYLKYPDIEDAYRNPQQYLLGDHLLVAPIAEPGIGPCRLARQAVWFPEGTWYNYFTGERLEGPCERLIAADIDEFPLYVRAGAPIPMQPYTPRMATSTLRHLIVRCWPGRDSETIHSTFHEDDGVTEGYRCGQCAATNLTYARQADTITITIGPTIGEYAGQVQERAYTIELPCTRRPGQATVDGQPAEATYDAATRTTRIQVPARSLRSGLQVIVNVQDAAPAQAAAEAFARRVGLDRVAPDCTITELLAQAIGTGNADQQELACRAAGIGLFDKNETFYGFPPDPVFFLYAPAELPVARKARFGLNKPNGVIKLASTRTPLDPKPLVHKLRRPASELLFPQDDAVTFMAQMTIAGKPVTFSQKIVRALPHWKFQKNLAPRAKATASSEWPGQPASAAIDGVVDGTPGDTAREWASNRQRSGAWLKLEWPSPVTAGRILLFDRPNCDDHILAGQLILSDGTMLPVGELPADGKKPLEIKIPPRKIRWLTFVVTKVSDATAWVGLSEIAVYSK